MGRQRSMAVGIGVVVRFGLAESGLCPLAIFARPFAMQTWDIRYTRSAYPLGLGSRLVGYEHRDGIGVADALAVARHGDARAILCVGGGEDLADPVRGARQREGASEQALQLALEAIAVPARRGQSAGGE